MRIALVFEVEPDGLQEFEEEHGGSLYEWAFGEICQNAGFGFLVEVRKEAEQGHKGATK